MKRTITVWIVMMMGVLPGVVRGQVDWVDYANNPVIDEAFDPGSVNIFRPSVIFDGATYHMWYGKTDGSGVESMGYATSPDGLAWTLVDAAVLQPSADPTRFDGQDASQGWVMAEGDTLKMWYTGVGPNSGNIGYAWSLDGIAWTRVDGAGIDDSVYDLAMDGSGALGLATPTVVKEGGTYHMWYSRITGFNMVFLGRIGYATSPDGITWTNVPGPHTDGAVLDWGDAGSFDDFTVLWPAVVVADSTFMMWYAAGGTSAQTGSLGCATSFDGVAWTKIPGNEANGSCFDGPHLASVIKQGGQYTMWYGMGGTTRTADVVHLAFSGESTPQNQVPTAPQITAPADQAEIAVGGRAGEDPAVPETPFEVIWTTATDPNGDPLNYTWQLATADDFAEANLLLNVGTGAETRFETTLDRLAMVLDQNGVTLGQSVTLFHRAVASDGQFSTPGPSAQVTLLRGTLVAGEAEVELPVSFALDQNYPNPFNPITRIGYAVPRTSRVTLTMYNVMGREVALLASGIHPAGRYTATWDATGFASGVYLYRLQAGAYSEIRSLLLLK